MNAELLRLEGEQVVLEPLAFDHAEALVRAATDGELWNLTYTVVPSKDTMQAWIDKALARHSQGREQPFVVIDRTAGTVVGSTRYMNIDRAHRKREIGSTWLARSVQRTAVNTEAKLLLLTHAFEACACVRVEFVTDVLNAPSRAALVRIGAKQEGILRNHMIMPDGRYRDSVCFSIIASEWPAIRQALTRRLQDHGPDRVGG